MNKRKVFITGASGFIGSYLLAKLAELGDELTILCREPRKNHPYRPALPNGIKVVKGDLLQPNTYREALIGQDIIIHLAADYRVGIAPTRSEHQKMYQTNVTGTLNLLDEAQKAQISQILYTSTTAALGETKGLLLDETHRHNGYFRSYYEETKQIAHVFVEHHQQQGMPIKIAICGGVFGQGDNSVLAQTLSAFFNKKIPFQISTNSTFQLCHVERLCDGLLRLLALDKPQETVLFTGDVFSMPEIFTLLSEIQKIPSLPIKDRRSLRPLAWLMDRLSMLGLTMPLSCEALRIMDGSTYTYSSYKAEQLLGWTAGEPLTEFKDYICSIAHQQTLINKEQK
ncbi:NAD-dependent epimerase/dehydratase family protein [Proteus vulgaris]|uniref:NAD-dependent epimerase/dehydratase family protein n=1 Tax=Proteus vulgaris TaxID=585 RepID=UPI001B395CCE|nr:NAD-dependent epimerase/dehydratase family protein [Proteus vulgaris]MBQ0213143.1 NAD-dependent epimerase/dehydratase family protein [Proteus vulgaris]